MFQSVTTALLRQDHTNSGIEYFALVKRSDSDQCISKITVQQTEAKLKRRAKGYKPLKRGSDPFNRNSSSDVMLITYSRMGRKNETR